MNSSGAGGIPAAIRAMGPFDPIFKPFGELGLDLF